MTYDELLADIDSAIYDYEHKWDNASPYLDALRAVVELHKPTVQTKDGEPICGCAYGAWTVYPCPTIQAIEKELK